ncbi:hypothetical protein PENTCL1PPCAC_22676 [Pristionchus entomophagus]|uniref:Orn/DAP/Arg decarboxylase 2 N-terminal domain-containing protein n=1 Tax=Pristionchus entomophagus TaxID=358040 RepID=A0AAV5U136_9BILA|nr:hypothetical protein PENTCL1PPCAC_22676 [Pristionchus entomophagus]
MTDKMNSSDCGGRRRLVSATYEGVGARWKEQLSDVSLAVYEETPDMEEIARRVASHNRGSFFVMDASRVEGAMEEWTRYLSHCSPFYPIGCNDDPLLLQLLTRRNNCNLQVSTMAELDRALSLPISPSRILFHSHLLTRKMLRLITSLQEPLHALVIDSEDSAIDASSLNPFQPLLLRISLSPNSDRVDLSMGMPMDEATECVPRLISMGVALTGISVQLMAEGEDMVERVRDLIRLLTILSPCGLSTLDVGDGMDSSSLYDTSFLLHCIRQSANLPHMKLMATPGRFFAATAFSLVTCIVGKRSMDAGVITRREEDWGREGFIYQTTQSVYGVFSNRLMGEKPHCQPLPLTTLTPCNGVDEHESAVLGSTIDSLDFPQRHARLPSLDIGDCLLWKEMGAYGARDEDSFPIYYYTGRDHWERLKGAEKDLLSDGGSEGETDVESDIDQDDMTECFGRVFN